MTPLEWLAWLVLLTVALAAGLAVTLSNGAVTRAIRRLEWTYRRQKSLELEQLQAQVLARREAEVRTLLAQPGGLERVLNQILADALPEVGACVGREGVLDTSFVPAPRFTVAGENGRLYLFTSSPEALRKVRMIGRKEQPIALDAAIHPVARAEVQAVWEHLAAQRLRGAQAPHLPRQAGWFLIVRDQPTAKEAKE